MELSYPVNDGLIDSFDDIEELWRDVMANRIGITIEDHPLMLVDPSHNTKQR